MKKKNTYVAIDKETREEISGLFSVETQSNIENVATVPAKITFIITNPKDILDIIVDGEVVSVT